MQKRRNSSALALELRLSCINPSIYFPFPGGFPGRRGQCVAWLRSHRGSCHRRTHGCRQGRLHGVQRGYWFAYTFSVCVCVCMCPWILRMFDIFVSQPPSPQNKTVWGLLSGPRATMIHFYVISHSVPWYNMYRLCNMEVCRIFVLPGAYWLYFSNSLTYSGLVTLYGDTGLGQRWLR